MASTSSTQTTPVEKEFIMQWETNPLQKKYTLLGAMAEGVEHLIIQEPDDDSSLDRWTDADLEALSVLYKKPSSLKNVTLSVKQVKSPAKFLKTFGNLVYQLLNIGLDVRGCQEVSQLLNPEFQKYLNKLDYLELSNFELTGAGLLTDLHFLNLKVLKIGLAHNYDDGSFRQEKKDLEPLFKQIPDMKELKMVILDFEDGIAFQGISSTIARLSAHRPEVIVKVTGQVLITSQDLESLISAASESNSRQVVLDVTVGQKVHREGKKYLRRQRVKTSFKSSSSSSLQDISSDSIKDLSDLSVLPKIVQEPILESRDFLSYYLHRNEPAV